MFLCLFLSLLHNHHTDNSTRYVSIAVNSLPPCTFPSGHGTLQHISDTTEEDHITVSPGAGLPAIFPESTPAKYTQVCMKSGPGMDSLDRVRVRWLTGHAITVRTCGIVLFSCAFQSCDRGWRWFATQPLPESYSCHGNHSCSKFTFKDLKLYPPIMLIASMCEGRRWSL